MPHVDLRLSEIQHETVTRVVHAGTKLVLIRTNGGIYAYPDECPHAFWPLSKGTVCQGILECPGHGWEFDVQTGRCLNAPDHCLSPVRVTEHEGTVRLEWNETMQPALRRCEAQPAHLSARP